MGKSGLHGDILAASVEVRAPVVYADGRTLDWPAVAFSPRR